MTRRRSRARLPERDATADTGWLVDGPGGGRKRAGEAGERGADEEVAAPERGIVNGHREPPPPPGLYGSRRTRQVGMLKPRCRTGV
jgi:hypothetical protein